MAEAALAGGATAVQLRAPELTDARLEALAGEIAERCRAAGFPNVEVGHHHPGRRPVLSVLAQAI